MLTFLFLLQKHSIVSKVEEVCTGEELAFLKTFSTTYTFNSTLLPIKSVRIQGDCLSYGYVVGLSENAKDEPKKIISAKFEALTRLAELITRVCPNVSRVCYIFGDRVRCLVNEITPTTLTLTVIDLLKKADEIATKEIKCAGYQSVLSAMPIILIPIHFDREMTLISQYPLRRHSVVIRPLITADNFATGVPAIPSKQISFKVGNGECTRLTVVKVHLKFLSFCLFVYSFSKRQLQRFANFLASLEFCLISPPSRRAPLNGSKCDWTRTCHFHY